MADQDSADVFSAQSQPCHSATTCSDCISLPSNCSWCSDTLFDDQEYFRCESNDKILENHECRLQFIINPSGTVSILSESKKESSAQPQPVNLFPKKVKLDMRPGMEFIIFSLEFLSEFPPLRDGHIIDFSFV